MSGPGALGMYSRNSGHAEFPAGIGPDELLNEADMAAMAPQRRHARIGVEGPALPGNDGFATGLVMAGRALDALDQARCLVVGIEVGFQSATVRLARPPSAVLNLREERACHTGPGGDRIHIMRAHYMGVTLEWRETPP